MTVLRKLSSLSRILEKFRNQFYFLKTTKSLTLFILFIWFWLLSHSQDYIEFHIDQPISLQVDEGIDKTIKEGEHVQIGGVPAPKEGNGDYIYEWSPTSGINEANAANPSIKPSETTSYTLFVTDKHECSASDDVKITVESTSTIKDQTKTRHHSLFFPTRQKTLCSSIWKIIKTNYISVNNNVPSAKTLYYAEKKGNIMAKNWLGMMLTRP